MLKPTTKKLFFEQLGEIFEKNGLELIVKSKNGKPIDSELLNKLCRCMLSGIMISDLGISIKDILESDNKPN